MTALLQKTTVDICPADIENPTLSAIYSYWNGKRGVRAMPARSEIHPPELP